MRAILFLEVLFLAGLAGAQLLPGNLESGADLFQRRCGGCHSLDRVMEGPRLRGVYGRRAGSTKDFGYSDPLRKADFVWGTDSLDKWLTDTETVVRNNDMSFRVPKAEERREIIAYLKSLSD